MKSLYGYRPEITPLAYDGVRNLLIRMINSNEKTKEFPQCLLDFLNQEGPVEFEKLDLYSQYHWQSDILMKWFPYKTSEDEDIEEEIKEAIRDCVGERVRGEMLSGRSLYYSVNDSEIITNVYEDVFELPWFERKQLVYLAYLIQEYARGEDSFHIEEFIKDNDMKALLSNISEDIYTTETESYSYLDDNEEKELVKECFKEVVDDLRMDIILSTDEGYPTIGFGIAKIINERYFEQKIDFLTDAFIYNHGQNVLFPRFVEEDVEFLKEDVSGNILGNIIIMPQSSGDTQNKVPDKKIYQDMWNKQKELILHGKL